jgi:hypothetical protein
MARFIRSSLISFVGVAASALWAGCNNADALVVVSVDANPMLTGITALHTKATVGTQTVEFDVRPASGAASITIPPELTFGIDVPHKTLGNMISIHVDAMSGTDVLGSADGSTSISAGHRADVSLTIGAPMGTDMGSDDGGSDMGGVVSPDTPRLIAPVSTSPVSSRRPLLKWVIASGTGSPTVDLCSDPACATMIGTATVDASGAQATPNADLPVGPVFWRVRSVAGMQTRTSATWEFFVPARSATGGVNTASGTILDINLDGLADLALGAPNVTLNSISAVGRFYVLMNVAGSGFSMTLPTAVDGREGGSSGWGSALGSAGDVNGDGFADLVVGVAKGGSSSPGLVYVYFGSANGLLLNSPEVITDPKGEAGGAFGAAVVGLGDVNGDGYADVAVSAPSTTVNSQTFAGRIFVFYGSPMGLVIDAGKYTSIDSPDATMHAGFGSALAPGDVNGDGYADLVVSSPGVLQSANNPIGRVYVYKGAASGLNTTAIKSFDGPVVNGNFGLAIGGTDVNGDGYSDVIIGASNEMIGSNASAGRVYIYLSSASGFVTAAAPIDGPNGANARFGDTVTSAGDVNGDGYGDIAIGSPHAAVSPNNNVGIVDVYLGGTTGVNVTALPINGLDAPGYFGWAIAPVADMTNDGFGDIVIGSIAASSFAGRVVLWEGASGGLKASYSRNWLDPDASGQLGQSVY